MSAATIHDLLISLEQTIHERFRMINQLLASQVKVPESAIIGELISRIQALEKRLDEAARQRPQELLPTSPMVGLEVFRKQDTEKVVVLNTVPATTLTAEAEVELYMGAASTIDAEDDIEAEAEVEVEVEAEAEVEVEAEAEEEEAVELEEFEYKGATYYRDSDNNVFTTDEDGELNDEPFGLWNEAKQRIVARR